MLGRGGCLGWDFGGWGWDGIGEEVNMEWSLSVIELFKGIEKVGG